MTCPGPSTVLSAAATAATLHVGILAGGVGKRFEPYSTPELPKQFLPITHESQSMLQVTAKRFEEVVPPERIWIATNARYVDLVREHAPDVPESNIIGEPLKKNTAPAIATMMGAIAARDGDAVAAIMPSDHFIGCGRIFIGQVLQAAKYARETAMLTTFGIPPTWASPEYGYIEAGAEDKEHPGFFTVKQFVEKPDPETAQEYMDSGNFSWNSGMFVWEPSAFLGHLAEYRPEMYEHLFEYYGSISNGFRITPKSLFAFFEASESISIDYALMEPASLDGNVAILPFGAKWSDVGSFEALERLVRSGLAFPPQAARDIMKEQLARKD